MRVRVEISAVPAVLLLAGLGAAAQDDVPLPPRIDEPPAANAPVPRVRPPERTRLAALPQDRLAQDEVIVVGQTEFRLPDLGSSWRTEQEAEQAAAARIRVAFLPLYDPETRAAASDVFLTNRETYRRHGVIELFRVRFGRRARD